MNAQHLPSQYERHGHHRVFLEAVYDVWRLVAVDTVDGAFVQRLRRTTQAVVQTELGRLLTRHSLQLVLNAFQRADRRQIRLQYDVQL